MPLKDILAELDAPAETLAKAANKLAKKHAGLGGVFNLTDHPDALEWLRVMVWLRPIEAG